MKKTVLITLAVFALISCWGKAEAEPMKTVEWFKDNPAHRASLLELCDNNPAKSFTAINCVNANIAERKVYSEKLDTLLEERQVESEMIKKLWAERTINISQKIVNSGKLPNTTEKVHTLQWFKDNPIECTAQLKLCKNNPGELSKTPNCINAYHGNRQYHYEIYEEKSRKDQIKADKWMEENGY